MANSFFQFKQFTVHQGKAAMKVSTDACIQGALAAKYFKKKQPNKFLDIGSGTGLLSLILAQTYTQSSFTAIEIDKEAFLQSEENFNNSPWANQFSVFNTTLQQFNYGQKFDAIICNPPFFHKHLNSDKDKRNLARHDDSLSKNELADGIIKLLNEEGYCCIMYPISEWDAWLKIATENGLHLNECNFIFPNNKKTANRVVSFFSKNQSQVVSNNFYIYKETGQQYTKEFIELMQDYYLSL